MDNFEILTAHEREEEEAVELLPKCEICGEWISDDTLIDVETVVYHKGCFLDKYEQHTMDYIL